MPEGEHARRGTAEISPQPLFLRRSRLHRDVAVQRHDMPAAEIEGVVAEAGRPRARAEVGEVAARVRCLVVMIAWRRAGSGQVTAPGWRVATLEVSQRTGRVGVVPRRKNLAWNAVEET